MKYKLFKNIANSNIITIYIIRTPMHTKVENALTTLIIYRVFNAKCAHVIAPK